MAKVKLTREQLEDALGKAREKIVELETGIAEQCAMQGLYEQLAELRGKVTVYERCFTMVETYIGKGVSDSYE